MNNPNNNHNKSDEPNPNAEQWKVPDKYIEDPEEAHFVANATKEDEEKIARAKKYADEESHCYAAKIPARKYKGKLWNLTRYMYNSDMAFAIREAKNARAAADHDAQIASDQYKQLHNL